jgi:hypothetical protein
MDNRIKILISVVILIVIVFNILAINDVFSSSTYSSLQYLIHSMIIITINMCVNMTLLTYYKRDNRIFH